MCLIQNSALLRVRESGHRADVNVESVVSQCNGSRLYMGKIVMSQFSMFRVHWKLEHRAFVITLCHPNQQESGGGGEGK